MLTQNPTSLAATLDAVTDAFFFKRPLTDERKAETALWIAGRQGLPLSYSKMFAPSSEEIAEGVKLFTGERMTSGAMIRHVLSEEACRAQRLLDVKDERVEQAYKAAIAGMMRFYNDPDRTTGMFCCGTCSVSFWRNLQVSGLAERERELEAGVKILKGYRDSKGRWGRFPFYYTLLALTEMPGNNALTEMKYAAPILERLLRRKPRGDVHDTRRRALAERILSVC